MLKIFKIISFLEGWSYLIMLFIGLPLKYLADNDIVIKTLGKPHGFLFLTYALLAIIIKNKMEFKRTYNHYNCRSIAVWSFLGG